MTGHDPNHISEPNLPEWLQAEVDDHLSDERRDRIAIAAIVCAVFTAGVIGMLAILDHAGVLS